MSNQYEDDIRSSLGAILLGGFGSVALSGVVALQTFLYFRLYRADHWGIKALVAWLWAVDAIHTCCIVASSWYGFAVHYGERDRGNTIPTTTALTLFFTCVASFSVQCYYARAIFKLSHGKWFLAAPVVLLSLARMAVGMVSTIKAVQLKTWAVFVPNQTPIITLGYAISVSVDVLVTVLMCWFFSISRSRDSLSRAFLATIDFVSTNMLIDTMITFTISSGLLTFVTTLVSMICWFALRGTLVFLGTHFLIGKFYALAMLTNLNTRRVLRDRHYRQSSDPRGFLNRRPVLWTSGTDADSKAHDASHPSHSSTSTSSQATMVGTVLPKLGVNAGLPVQVSVERTIRYDAPVLQHRNDSNPILEDDLDVEADVKPTTLVPLVPLRRVPSDGSSNIPTTLAAHRMQEVEILVEREGDYNPYNRERQEYGGSGGEAPISSHGSAHAGAVGWGFGHSF